MAKPNALAMPSRLIAVGPAGANPPIAAAPQPKNTNANVPINSATCLFIVLFPPYCSISDRTSRRFWATLTVRCPERSSRRSRLRDSICSRHAAQNVESLARPRSDARVAVRARAMLVRLRRPDARSQARHASGALGAPAKIVPAASPSTLSAFERATSTARRARSRSSGSPRPRAAQLSLCCGVRQLVERVADREAPGLLTRREFLEGLQFLRHDRLRRRHHEHALDVPFLPLARFDVRLLERIRAEVEEERRAQRRRAAPATPCRPSCCCSRKTTFHWS